MAHKDTVFSPLRKFETGMCASDALKPPLPPSYTEVRDPQLPVRTRATEKLYDTQSGGEAEQRYTNSASLLG